MDDVDRVANCIMLSEQQGHKFNMDLFRFEEPKK
jgi:hypothetical protein